MDIQNIKPSEALLPYIQRYWSWEDTAGCGGDLPMLLPGTGIELVFHYYSPFLLNFDMVRDPNESLVHIICSRQKAFELKAPANTGFLAIRFRPDALKHFCDNPLTEMKDSFLAAEKIFEKELINKIKKKIDEAVWIKERVEIVEKMLLKLLSKHKKHEPSSDYDTDRLYYMDSVTPALAAEEELNADNQRDIRPIKNIIPLDSDSLPQL